jgi:hypothetical protein
MHTLRHICIHTYIYYVSVDEWGDETSGGTYKYGYVYIDIYRYIDMFVYICIYV